VDIQGFEGIEQISPVEIGRGSTSHGAAEGNHVPKYLRQIIYALVILTRIGKEKS
jgi:hypothetical protein